MIFSTIGFFSNEIVNAESEIIYVDDDANPSWYNSTHVKTIQEGIDNASSGDIIFVYNGTYIENLVIDKTISLIGEDKNSTIIDGNKTANTIHVKVDAIYTNISGFTIKNSRNVPEVHSGGITLISMYNNINDCIIENNDHGIHLYDADYTTILNCIIRNNAGGGIFTNSGFSQNDNCIIYNNNFSYNGWGGIVLYKAIDFTIHNNSFHNDGIIMLGPYQTRYRHNIETSNTVNSKPIYYYYNMTDLNISDIDMGQLFLVKCNDIQVENQSYSNAIAGCQIAHSSNITINNSKFINNYEEGIDIVYSNNISIQNCIINSTGNTSNTMQYDAGLYSIESRDIDIINWSEPPIVYNKLR